MYLNSIMQCCRQQAVSAVQVISRLYITSSTPGQRCLAECGMRVKQVHEQHTCSARGGGQTAEVLVREVLHRWKEKEGRLLRLREAGQGCPSPGGG